MERLNRWEINVHVCVSSYCTLLYIMQELSVDWSLKNGDCVMTESHNVQQGWCSAQRSVGVFAGADARTDAGVSGCVYVTFSDGGEDSVSPRGFCTYPGQSPLLLESIFRFTLCFRVHSVWLSRTPSLCWRP